MKRLLTVLAFATLAACGSDSTGPQSGLEGEYLLQSVNGLRLPVSWESAGPSFYTLHSYRITILRGNLWSSSESYSYASQGAESKGSRSDTGTYKYVSSSGFVSLLSQDRSGALSGVVSGNELRITQNSGELWVFSR